MTPKNQNNKKCGEKMECYQRVCGFYRPVMCFNLGKKEEFKMRKNFNLDPFKSNLEKEEITDQ